MFPPYTPERWVRLHCPSLRNVDRDWEILGFSLSHALQEKRGMRGSLIYCPGITDGDAVATRIFRLTYPDDYPIILESPVLEPFLEYHGDVFRGDSLTITPWNPYSTRCEPNHTKENLRSVARWQYQVTQAMTQPPSRAQRFLYLLRNDGPADVERGLTAWLDIFKGLHHNVCLPIRFPAEFLPIGIAKFTLAKGWVSNIRSCRPRHCEGFHARIIWECESIPGRFPGWSACEPPSTDELIRSHLYEQSTSTEPTFIVGYVGGLYKKFVEVYAGDIISADPIESFQILPPAYTDYMLSGGVDY